MFSMSRLHPSAGRRSASQRPVTPNASTISPKEVKEKEKLKPSPVASLREKESRDPAMLRKRTSSAPPTPSPQPKSSPIDTHGVGLPLTEGKSIFQQIGEPDHNGWMRKKGERYNSWKLRYFVLKGDHLYWLKSSHKTVRWRLSFGRVICTDNNNAGNKSQGIHQHSWLQGYVR